MRELPRDTDIQGLYGTKPDYIDPKAPSPVDWWAVSNGNATSVLAFDFATGFISQITLPASGLVTRLFPQGMAVREPMIVNFSTSPFEVSTRQGMTFGDGQGAWRIPAGAMWTKYGITSSTAYVNALLGAVRIQDGATGSLATVRGGADGLGDGAWLGLEALAITMMLNPAGSLDQLRSIGNADGYSPTGVLAAGLALMRGDGNYNRAQAANQIGDGDSGANMLMASLRAYNGATQDRLRAAAAAVLGAFSTLGALVAQRPIGQPLVHSPAANTLATVNRAGVAGTRYICRRITASFVTSAALAAAATVQVLIRDGASGAGAILWQATISLANGAAAGSFQTLNFEDLAVIGTVGNQMTVEFSGAGGANTTEVINAEIIAAT